ncbi:MAG: hypothetical protein M3R65_07355 [Gemmatimonadota bacterium]|nr:hypothetical protein [Gemmatimonadota bacterium]
MNAFRGWKNRDKPTAGVNRRGSALILTLVLTLSLASLATSAIYLGGNEQMLANSYDQERDMRYADEAILQMGKSTLNYDPYAAPDSGYRVVQNNVQVTGADGNPIPGITASMYLGPTSSNTGQFGRFVSVVAVAQNAAGAKVVRRLELAQESFAKFAYWSNQETNNGNPIYFNNNDQLWGPVWSNDQVNIGSGGARFHGTLGTAQTVSGAGYGTFDAGYSENQKPIALPNNTTLSSLSGYAGSGGLSFAAPNSSSVDQAMMRIEFVARPFNGGAGGVAGLPLNGPDDGFMRVYVSKAGPGWLRGDYSLDNCGASYVFTNVGTGLGSPSRPAFVPLSEHTQRWFKIALQNSGNYNNGFINQVTSGNPTLMQSRALGQPSARCYLGGDPNLRAVSYRSTIGYRVDTLAAATGIPALVLAAAQNIAGDSTTFFVADSATNPMGYWKKYPGAVSPQVAALWPAEAPYLFPLYRGLNPGTKGVIYVSGTTGVSGTLRARVTLYATGNVAILRDTKYVTDPSLNNCTADMLGIISGNNIYVADNALQDPPFIPGLGYKNMDDTKDVFLQGVMMALKTAFGAENYTNGPNDVNGCEGTNNGRGCLYLTGGIIQQQRGPVGLSDGTGFAKRYSYDKCALYNPPPYFPTTGRYTDNRYYEIDPAGFDVAALFRSLTP